MPTPPAVDRSRYRQYEFLGARILEAREVTALQNLAVGDQPTLSSFALGALYQNGATLNVQPVFSTNTSCTLSPINSQYPMYVFVNGRFETLTPVSINFPAVQTNGTAQPIYLNWILWRVTVNGANGTLQDATLLDTGTQEPTANAGQLQLYVGADDSGPVNSTTMLARNTSAIPMITLVWQNNALQLGAYTSAQPMATGVSGRFGLLGSTTDNPQVVADDDPRTTDARNPRTSSVASVSVMACPPTGGTGHLTYHDETNTEVSVPYTQVSTNPTASGISSDKLVYPAWAATLTDTLSLLWGRIVAIYTVLAAYGTRLSTLESQPTVDYSWHVGKTLGITGTNKSTHPPVVDNSNPDTTYVGFTVKNSAGLGKPGNAYAVTLSDGTVVGQIQMSGDYAFLHPNYTANLEQAGADFRFFSQLAGWAVQHKTLPLGIRGRRTGPDGFALLDTHDPSVDNRDPNTTEAGFQVIGSPRVSWDYAYAVKDDNGVAQGAIDFTGNYQYLHAGTADNLFANGYDFRNYYSFAHAVLGWLTNPALPGTSFFTPRTENRSNGVWTIFKFGNVVGSSYEIAFGSGQMNHGEMLDLPVGFASVAVGVAMPMQMWVSGGRALNRIESYLTDGTSGPRTQMHCVSYDTTGAIVSNIGFFYALSIRSGV